MIDHDDILLTVRLFSIMAAAASAVQSEQADELEDCVTYQHVKLLESAGIGLFYLVFFSFPFV